MGTPEKQTPNFDPGRQYPFPGDSMHGSSQHPFGRLLGPPVERLGFRVPTFLLSFI